MSILKKLGRSGPVQTVAAWLAAKYLRLVESTTRYQFDPPDLKQRALADAPVIAGLWHGQHIMAHFAWPPGMRVAALISRNADAEINAKLLEHLGVIPIRGSGGTGSQKTRKRGGALALREMLRILSDGISLVLTSDVPKVSRVAGKGIVTLARLSGRPIYPLAVVNSRRVDFNSWDRASIGLPFSRGAVVVGTPIRVAPDADDDAMETARRALEAELDRIHAKAYAMVGSRDPGGRAVKNSDRQKSIPDAQSPHDYDKETG
ncbi:lysophospholipid acyltransferase family protein [Roseiarcaceae bacterium H3SJ34-1]|uniref:lysophospholipid acyltransferase family protein n=1 Tax=Terripilifer ovatus TaxID=3032367 RepID=UPI003AB93C4F|nr:lysophospholipid acyltransferase family protein [Roseiarcaceae bacterium H3SJ34-1]